MSEIVDGRRARGAARREELIQAALAVMGRDGLSAVTHRAVAEEAGVPLASASYHFHGLKDLIDQAMQRASEDLAKTLEGRPADSDGPGGLAELVFDAVTGERDLLLAEYEFYLHTARNGGSRGIAMAWLDLVADAYARELVGSQRQAFKALIEGVFLHSLLQSESADRSTIEATLRAGWPRSPGDS